MESVGNPYSQYDQYGIRHVLRHLLSARRWQVSVRLLEEFEFLEEKTSRLGVDELLEDLSVALHSLPSEGDLCSRILHLLQVIDREAHNLRGWKRELHPAFLAQQIGNRASDLNLPQLVSKGEDRLSWHRQPYLTLLWCRGPQSPAVETTLAGHREVVLAVAIVPHEQRIISGYADGVLKVWDLQTGQETRTLSGHDLAVNDVALTPDGRWAVSAAADSTLKVWNLDAGERIHTLAAHTHPVNAVAITSDGVRVISASADQSVMVWNLLTGDLERSLVGTDRS